MMVMMIIMIDGGDDCDGVDVGDDYDDLSLLA